MTFFCDLDKIENSESFSVNNTDIIEEDHDNYSKMLERKQGK
jgi:hypothetical protein